MADAIDNAVAKTQQNVSNAATNAKEQLTDQVTDTINDKLSQLPLDVDPELLLEQKKAQLLYQKAKLEQDLLIKKEILLGLRKEDVLAFALTLVPGLPKLPPLDPRLLAAYSLAMQAKEAIKNKNVKSKANIKKGKELLKYRIKEKLAQNMPQVPNIPNLPTISAVPNIPEIPDIPEFPEIPEIRIPSGPKLPS